MKTIEEGDDVLFWLDVKRTYMVRVDKGKQFHTHKGFIELEELIGKPYGIPVISSLGVTFYALRPLIRDRILKTNRRTQVLYPKDIGYLILQLDIGPDSRVVEAGTGSGALTMALANAVRPSGKIYSYEINPKFQNVAAGNIKRARLVDYVEMKNKDILKGIDENEVDAVVLDMATPWLVVPYAYKALVGGGVLASFSPTIEQVKKTVAAMKDHQFMDIETVELILRRITVEENRTRPETLMIGHSGYLSTGRKVFSTIS
jgi:tRNA (adenine57-N1/adenine58-N1)-methyltransferase